MLAFRIRHLRRIPIPHPVETDHHVITIVQRQTAVYGLTFSGTGHTEHLRHHHSGVIAHIALDGYRCLVLHYLAIGQCVHGLDTLQLVKQGLATLLRRGARMLVTQSRDHFLAHLLQGPGLGWLLIQQAHHQQPSRLHLDRFTVISPFEDLLAEGRGHDIRKLADPFAARTADPV